MWVEVSDSFLKGSTIKPNRSPPLPEPEEPSGAGPRLCLTGAPPAEILHMAPDPEPGDLIEVYRGAYNHWAVYIGDGDVVHLVVPDGGGGGSSGSSGSSGSLLGFLPGLGGTKGLVRRESLRDVAGTDPWLVNNAMDQDEEPYPPEQIVKRALKRVGDRVRYHLVKFNCEHFAKELRYGVAESSQVKEVEKGNVFNALVEVQVRTMMRPMVQIFRN